jgi:hypothetical protein
MENKNKKTMKIVAITIIIAIIIGITINHKKEYQTKKQREYILDYKITHLYSWEQKFMGDCLKDHDYKWCLKSYGMAGDRIAYGDRTDGK